MIKNFLLDLVAIILLCSVPFAVKAEGKTQVSCLSTSSYDIQELGSKYDKLSPTLSWNEKLKAMGVDSECLSEKAFAETRDALALTKAQTVKVGNAITTNGAKAVETGLVVGAVTTLVIIATPSAVSAVVTGAIAGTLAGLYVANKEKHNTALVTVVERSFSDDR